MLSELILSDHNIPFPSKCSESHWQGTPSREHIYISSPSFLRLLSPTQLISYPVNSIMAYRWRPPEPGENPHSGTSKNSSTIARKSVRSAIPIPTGTVASRVYHLQSLSKATAAAQHNPTGLTPGPGDSQLSPKRPRNPFATLFWRKATPDDKQEDAITHFSPEPVTSQSNHDELQSSHGVKDQHEHHQNAYHTGQTALGDREGETCDRDCPAQAPASDTWQLSAVGGGEDGHRLDGPQEERDLRARLQSHLRGVPVPSRNARSFRQRPQRPEIFRSESSNTTTSTMRRQSVRELFEDRGIERPAGLASPKNSSDDTSYKYHPSKAHVSCHHCSFKNKYVQIQCQKCGHHFCNRCPASPIFPHNPFSQSFIHPPRPERYMGRSKIPAGIKKQRRVSVDFKQRKALNEGVEHTIASAARHASCDFPLQQEHLAHNFARRVGATWKPHRDPIKRDNHNLTTVPATCEHRSMQTKADTCNATAASQPNNFVLPEQKTSHYYSKLDSRVRRKSKSESSHSQTSRPQAAPLHHEAGTSNNFHNVVCHGYPRTGHDRCGSPVESGIVGECQHCLDDCDCLGCRSTYHGVRCCINKDHLSVSHYHQVSEKALRAARSRKTLSPALEERAPLPPLVTTPLKVGQLEGSDSPRGPTVKSTEKLQSKYPVEYIDHVKKGEGKKFTSSAILPKGTSIGDLPVSNNALERRDSHTLTFEQFRDMGNSRNEIQNSGPVIQPQRRNSKPSPNALQKIPVSPFSKLVKRPSHESLKLQLEQKEQRRERLIQMAQKETKDPKTDAPSKKKVEKAERKYQKQVLKLKKEEAKLKLYGEDKSIDERTLLLNYEIGPSSQRVQQQPSPLTRSESRTGQRTPDPLLHDNYETRSSLTTSMSRNSDQQAHCANVGNRERFEAKTKATEIRGITVIVHMSNNEDMIFRLDASMAESTRS